MYCDKTAEVRYLAVFTNMLPNALTLCLSSLMTKFEGGPLDQKGSNGGVVVFDRLRDAVSRKQCEIELNHL